MALTVGRVARIYTKIEAAYGVQETLAAANILRTTPGVALTFDPFGRVTSPEKKSSPGAVNRFDRKKVAALGNLPFLLRPSGTLNTLPECDPVFQAAFGSRTNVTLATTVASGSTTTGATVASAGTLAVGDVVQIEVTGQSGSPFPRFLTAVAGAALTWAPALPAAPAVGDDVKGGITYKLATALALSLTLGKFGTNKNEAGIGIGIDVLNISAPANEEMNCVASGPAKQVLSATTTPALQADPATITTVGGNPPSSLTGELLVDGAAYKIRDFELGLTNALMIRDQEYGVNGGTEIYRRGRREITFNFNAFAETPATAFDKAEAGSNVTILNQTGSVSGNIIALYLPRVEFKRPVEDDPDEEKSWAFTGLALETADGLNDECRLGMV